jgi:glutamate-1-semialdehyde 2,1-aminomutase
MTAVMAEVAWQALVDEYEARTTSSRRAYDDFCAYMPGGTTRSVAHYDPYPVVLESGEGAIVRDVDGNEYIDVLNNYTALVHGHVPAAPRLAAESALAHGTVFPAPHAAQLELARLLCERYPAVERVRFTNSGSEAALLALRIARAATGRQRVVMFENAYHGSVPDFIDPGADTLQLPYNDRDEAAAQIDSSIAAVFVEPFLGSGGVIPGEADFLLLLQQQARSVGAVFVLDEVQALRNAVHGMHTQLGLEPDLLLMGKIIGGGFPVGAVGGRAPLLDYTTRRLSHSGTFNGNVVTMSAGVATLRELDEAAIDRLNRLAADLAEQIQVAGQTAGIRAELTRAGSILHVHLPESSRAAAALHLALLLEGVYAAPRGMLNLSTALDETRLRQVSEAYGKAFRRLSASPLAGNPDPTR